MVRQPQIRLGHKGFEDDSGKDHKGHHDGGQKNVNGQDHGQPHKDIPDPADPLCQQVSAAVRSRL